MYGAFISFDANAPLILTGGREMFKPGDKVKCVDASGVTAVKKDGIYTISEYWREPGTDTCFVNLEGREFNGQGLWAHRFRKVEP